MRSNRKRPFGRTDYYLACASDEMNNQNSKGARIHIDFTEREMEIIRGAIVHIYGRIDA